MTWHTRFKERLALGGEPMFALDFQSPDLLGSGSTSLTPHRYVLHSHSAPSDDRHIPNAIARVSSTGQRVNVRSWKSSMGGLRVTLAGADVAQFLAMVIPRGMVAEFKVGFEGFTYEQFETVGLYTFRGLSGSRNNWTMEFSDFFTLLQAPESVHLSGQFYKAAGQNQALVDGGYTVGDTELDVTAISGTPVTTANFPRDTSSGARGLLYCEPSSGDPFFLKFTDLTGLTFDVIDANVIGTTRADLSAGDRVTVYGYVHDMVPDVAYMVLFGGLAGASTMPDNWHMDLNYSSHLTNRTDLNRWRSRWTSFYMDFNADLIVSAPMENAYRGLEEFLSAFGWWLVFKEGALSFRFVQRTVPAAGYGPLDVADYVITDADIVSEDGYQLYNPDAPVEYFQVYYPSAISTDTASPFSSVGTRPAEFRLNHPSRDRVFNDDVSSGYESQALINLRGRLDPWYARIPDQMSLTLKGWRFAELVPGDVVSLESNYIYDMVNGFDIMLGESVDRHHNGTQYLVTGVDVNWSDFSVSVQLSTPPYTA